MLGFIRETWEKLNTISIVALLGLIGGMIGTISSAFIKWRTDRGRLKQVESDEKNLREDFEYHKSENMETFKEIRESIHNSNKDVVDKIDELKMYLLQSKITEKGERHENTKDRKV